MKYIADIYVRYYNKKYGRIGHLLQDAIARCQAKTTLKSYWHELRDHQAKTTLKSYWHELRDHQEYSKKIAMKTGTHTQVPLTTIVRHPAINNQFGKHQI